MATEIRVPALGDSVTEATVGKWFKQAGDQVAADEPVVELETDKVTLEVPAPAAGVLSEIVVKAGDTVAVGAVLGAIQARDGKAAAPAKVPEPAKELKPTPAAPAVAAEAAAEAPKRAAGPIALQREPVPREEFGAHDHDEMPPSPAARKLLAEKGIGVAGLHGSGGGARC